MQQSYKRASTNLRRIIKYDIRVSGHFAKTYTQTPGRLNNSWTTIFNIRTQKIILMYRVKNGLAIIMYRKKSPYHRLLTDLITETANPTIILKRRIPKIEYVSRLNMIARGLRPERKSDRLKADQLIRKLHIKK